MPELPEVETIVRSLSPSLTGKIPEQVVIRSKSVRVPIPTDLASRIVGKPIQLVRRRAKWPAIVFDTGCLWLHLGMTGQILIYSGVAPRAGTHDHMDIIFKDGSTLRFTDPRRFGVIAWTDGPESNPPTSTLGPEPLDTVFDAAMLKKQLERTGRPIKTAIMDGAVVAGVGNIYASEALFLAGIHPDTPANTLNSAQLGALANAIKAVLCAAIEAGGSTLKDYRTPDGKTGNAQGLHRVYSKAGDPCDVCATPIATANHSGRATFWCEHCQPRQCSGTLF